MNDTCRYETNGEKIARTWAVLHGMAALEPLDALAYEDHLAQCTPCRERVATLAPFAAELCDEDEDEDEPSPALRQRLGERIAALAAPVPDGQVWKGWSGSRTDAPFVNVPADAPFERTAFPGVEARRLFVDRERRTVTMMVRMAAHSAYPGHRHAGPEECFVVAGSLRVGDELVMRAGDYQRAARGSAHPVQATEEGCLLFIVSSLDDELVA